MSKAKTILILGVWMTVLPYLGFPHFLKNLLLSLSGLGICFVGYVMHRDLKTGRNKEAE